VTEQTFLARFVVIRRDEKGAVSAEFLGHLCIGDRVLRGVGTCAGENQAPFFCSCNREANDLLAFLVRQCWRFARGAYSNNSADSGGDLAFDQLLESGNVNRTIAKWCD
jgi:hypothetical protein